MVEPMKRALEADPDALAGQIIFQKDGYNMSRRTPVAFGLKQQLELLQSYGYRVVTVEQLMADYSPFADVGREEPGFEKLVALQKTRGIVFSDNRLRLDDPMTWGELAMLLAPRAEAIGRRVAKIRETGTPQHANWGAMDWCAEQGILKYAMDPDGTVSSRPSQGLYPPPGLCGLSWITPPMGEEIGGNPMEEVVTLQLEAPLALVTLNRPKSLNALNSEVYRQLIDILRRVEGMDDIKAVILTGAGDKAFAAGADIAQMVHEDSMAARRLSGLCHEAAGLLENMRQVTIAAVNGYALGGGCELTLACDIRIAAEQARFALPEVTLGIIPGGGGTQRLARLIGAGRAKEMIFTGDQIDAQEAWRIGLVNHVVPKEDLLEACRTLGKKIASRASYAVYLAKTAINSSQEIDLKNGAQREMDLMGLAFATHDKQEGMEAFLARRPPEFQDF